MTGESTVVRAHYGSDNIVDRIINALAEAGHDTENLSVDTLCLADQLHGGGLGATVELAQLVGVTADLRVLDAGCGVGGGARYLAHTFGCRVEAIDLTPEFVEAATRLNALCGMNNRINVRQGSVTDLPYDDASFDLAWSQNVTMNVEDKASMFSEVFRVLAPGGRFTFSHMAQGPGGTPYYPLSWAKEPAYSFLGTPEEIMDLLKDTGFVDIEDLDRERKRGSSLVRSSDELDSTGIILGPEAPARRANSARSAKEGRLASMVVLAHRPA